MNNQQSIIDNQFPIVFFGTGKYVLPILETLKSSYEIPLVLTTEKSDSEPVSKFAQENGIKLISVAKFDEDVDSEIKKTGAEVAVLAYFGMILPKQILKLFPKGIINVHPSLLPKYRGPTPGQTALLNGDKTTGVSIIRLDQEVDHGPILVQQEVEILPNDTASTLYERLFKIGSQILAKTLPKYLSGKLKSTEQGHSKATLTKTLMRDSGFIDIASPPAVEEIENMIKAYFPWPGVWTKATINNKLSIIKFLPERRIQVEGGKPMSYKDFLNGYPKLQPELVGLLEKLQ